MSATKRIYSDKEKLCELLTTLFPECGEPQFRVIRVDTTRELVKEDNAENSPPGELEKGYRCEVNLLGGELPIFTRDLYENEEDAKEAISSHALSIMRFFLSLSLRENEPLKGVFDTLPPIPNEFVSVPAVITTNPEIPTGSSKVTFPMSNVSDVHPVSLINRYSQKIGKGIVMNITQHETKYGIYAAIGKEEVKLPCKFNSKSDAKYEACKILCEKLLTLPNPIPTLDEWKSQGPNIPNSPDVIISNKKARVLRGAPFSRIEGDALKILNEFYQASKLDQPKFEELALSSSYGGSKFQMNMPNFFGREIIGELHSTKKKAKDATCQKMLQILFELGIVNRETGAINQDLIFKFNSLPQKPVQLSIVPSPNPFEPTFKLYNPTELLFTKMRNALPSHLSTRTARLEEVF